MCGEAVLIGWTGYHKRKCFVETKGHRIHRATHPNGTQIINWSGAVGRTKIWLEENAA